MTVMLFMPEVLDLTVSGVHCVVKGLGDLYEDYMTEDLHCKNE
jgi:hypothetical protein